MQNLRTKLSGRVEYARALYLFSEHATKRPFLIHFLIACLARSTELELERSENLSAVRRVGQRLNAS